MIYNIIIIYNIGHVSYIHVYVCVYIYACICVCVCVCVRVYGKMKKKMALEEESVLRMTGQTIIYKTEAILIM